jgi:hypothetical protein
MNLFFFRLISEILPNINLFEGFYIKFLNNSNSFLFVLNKALFIFELQKYYFFFRDLPTLNINIVTNSTFIYELIFILKSYKFPLIFYKDNNYNLQI